MKQFDLLFKTQKQLPTVEVIFDGGCKPNPGRGYGSYQLKINRYGLDVIQLDHGDGHTSNTAEYLTLIQGLRDLLQMVQPEKFTLIVRGDSKIVINQVRAAERKWQYRPNPNRAHHLEVYKKELAEMLNQFAEVRAVWHGRKNSVELFGH